METNDYSFYTVDVVQSVKSLSFQLKGVMRAVNYDRFTVKTFFISQSR